MVAIKNFILFAATATAALLPRDAATAKKDLATINNDTITLTKAGNAYTGNGANLVPVVNAESQLENDLDASAGRAKNQPTFSSTDAQAIIDYINKTLEPNVKAAVKSITDKKAQYTADGVNGIVLNDLKSIKNRTDVLGASLVKSAGSAKSSAAQAALNIIDADLQAGINAFS